MVDDRFERLVVQDVSSPTVESHARRLFQTGVIRRISAVLDIDKMKSEVSALILLKVDLSELKMS